VDATAYSGTIGLPMPSTELKLLDDDGHEVPAGQPGEIAIRGPQVMAGYWQRPDETAKVMTADGFFRTGDIGVIDERGHFRIVDRKKDMILVSRLQRVPQRGRGRAHADARRAGMRRRRHPRRQGRRGGEGGHRQEGPGADRSRVRSFCEANLTGYKRPKVVEFRPDLPKTTVGKILRRELRAGAPRMSLAQALETKGYQTLYDRITAEARPRLGLIKGYKLILEVERCSGPAEIRALAQRFVEQVRAADGDAAAVALAQTLLAPG
jgi:acyl-CoA synthetase (AMP-forming)/AMP-acid ligase II